MKIWVKFSKIRVAFVFCRCLITNEWTRIYARVFVKFMSPKVQAYAYSNCFVCFFAWTSSRISEWPWLGYACDPIPVTFRLSRVQLQTLTGKRENILSHPLFSRLLMCFSLLLVSLFNILPINHSFIAPASTLNFAQHYFMDLELLVVEGRGGSKQPPCMCWTFETVCLLPKIAGHSRGSSYLGTERPSVFPNVGTLNFCSAALLLHMT